MRFHTVYFGKHIIWSVSRTVLFLFLGLIAASVAVIGTTPVPMVIKAKGNQNGVDTSTEHRHPAGRDISWHVTAEVP